MRGIASPERRQSLPKSLMQRLALMANGEPLALRAGGIGHSPRTGARLGALLWFGLGVLASGIVGGVALLGLHASTAGEVRIEDDPGVVPAVLAEAHPATPERNAQPDTFDLAIDRSERTAAPLGLRVTGTDDANIEIVLQGIPEAARLSHGERRDASTWVLKRADLENLHLALGDAAPDAFDVRIDVLATPGVATLGSVVRVRLVDPASRKQAMTAPGEDRTPYRQSKAVAASTDVAKSAPAHAPSAVRTEGNDKAGYPPAKRRAPTAADASTPAPQAAPWPEGASGLGAIPRDSERQVWWAMPPPSWSPF